MKIFECNFQLKSFLGQPVDLTVVILFFSTCCNCLLIPESSIRLSLSHAKKKKSVNIVHYFSNVHIVVPSNVRADQHRYVVSG